MGSHARDCLIKEKKVRSKKKKKQEKTGSQSSFLRQCLHSGCRLLIMFGVLFSHYLVCSSVVQVKSSAKDQHSKTLKRGCQHNSALDQLIEHPVYRSPNAVSSLNSFITVLYDSMAVIESANFFCLH